MTSSFTLPRLILCEGPEDQTFLSKLIESRMLKNWHIRHPGKPKEKSGGNTKFGEYLRALKVGRNGFEKIKRLVIVTDADLDPDAAFKSIQSQLLYAEIIPPTEPNSSTNGIPQTAIMLMPEDGHGCLETVCIEAAASQAKPILKDYVNDFVNSVADYKWNDVQKSKLWLGSMMAASWQKDPRIQLAPLLLSQKPNQLVIPMNHKSFDWIANRLEAWAN